jgi:site-specific recombinase XerD
VDALATQETVLANLATLADQARAFAENARAANTTRAYESDLADFCAWARARELTCLPASAETVSLYVADLAPRVKPATIRRRLASISAYHKAAGYESPTSHGVVKAVATGVRRTLGVAQAQKDALSVDDLRRMIVVSGSSLLGVRDRALLLIGFAGALRRSEIVALTVEDVKFEHEGVSLTLRRSKTNQEGETEIVPVLYGSDPATCPVRNLRAWIDAAGITSGPIFREVYKARGTVGEVALSDRMVAVIVKRLAKRAGLDPEAVAGHSLRSGFATSAARAGASEAAIMRQTRHKSVTVARRYIRQGTRWEDHAGARIGL